MLQCNENSHEQAVNLQPLTDAELDKLDDILKRFGDKCAMNLETLDGFFAAPDLRSRRRSAERVPPGNLGRLVNEPAFQTRPRPYKEPISAECARG
jgi:hypothetical protein